MHGSYFGSGWILARIVWPLSRDFRAGGCHVPMEASLLGRTRCALRFGIPSTPRSLICYSRGEQVSADGTELTVFSAEVAKQHDLFPKLELLPPTA